MTETKTGGFRISIREALTPLCCVSLNPRSIRHIVRCTCPGGLVKEVIIKGNIKSWQLPIKEFGLQRDILVCEFSHGASPQRLHACMQINREIHGLFTRFEIVKSFEAKELTYTLAEQPRGPFPDQKCGSTDA